MSSIWESEKHYGAKLLNSDINTDTVIIGAGMAGVLTTRLLSERGVDTVLLEGGTVGSGQTKNTTAKITAQHGMIYSEIIKRHGREAACKYAEANMRAIDEYKKIIEKNKIDCDFIENSSYLYSQRKTAKITDEADAARLAGIEAELTTETELPFSVNAALKFKNQAQFNPLKFLYPLSKSLNIYQYTGAVKIKGNIVFTGGGRVKAKNIIISSHYPFINFPGFYFMRMHQQRSYVIAVRTDSIMKNMYLGIDSGSLSFRGYKENILIGGASHRCGENKLGGRYEELRKKARLYYPKHIEAANWSAQDCMTLDRIPYIGKFSGKGNVYIATGFNKWGMTSSMVSAMILRDMIIGEKNDCAPVFSPSRRHMIALSPLLNELYHSAKGMSKQLFTFPIKSADSIQPGHGGTVWYNGKIAGVYKREDGRIFAVSARCPHLGCRLEWNPDEKSWDCPCHGSRYDYRGRLIDNPAVKGDISIK